MKRHDDSQRSGRLAVTQRGESRLTRIWAGLYTRPQMGTDSIQPSRRLPTTDYRLPTTDYRHSQPHGAGADRGGIDPCGVQPHVSARPPVDVVTREASTRRNRYHAISTGCTTASTAWRASKEVRGKGITQRPGGCGR